MSYKNKTYVCLDYDTDKSHYNLMKAWKENDKIDFNFHNAHDLNNLRDGSSEETIKSKLRERFSNTKIVIVLVGKHTKDLYKFVRWEIEIALKLGLPIIVVNLNGERNIDKTLCPPILREELALHISFGQKIIKKALDSWQTRHYELKEEKETGAYFYKDNVYENL